MFFFFFSRLAVTGESVSQQRITSSEMSPLVLPGSPTQTLSSRTGTELCPWKLAMLKYVHALPCTTQCDSVEEQSRACGAGIFFVYDQQSGWTWPGDKDAVCGMMLVWCPPA